MAAHFLSILGLLLSGPKALSTSSVEMPFVFTFWFGKEGRKYRGASKVTELSWLAVATFSSGFYSSGMQSRGMRTRCCSTQIRPPSASDGAVGKPSPRDFSLRRSMAHSRTCFILSALWLDLFCGDGFFGKPIPCSTFCFISALKSIACPSQGWWSGV